MEINKVHTTISAEVDYDEVNINYSDVLFEEGVSFSIEHWQEIKEYVDKKIINYMGVKSEILGDRDGV